MNQSNKAPVGIALMAKNSAKTLGRCLDSIVPYAEQVVVCVDRDTTDNTAEIARAHGAEVHEGLIVSEEHTCPDHGTVMAQHFARARQQSFSYLRKDLPFHGWLDADDHLEGGEKLAKALANIPAEVAGLWLPYDYSKTSEDGPTSTLFDRERIVRSDIPWEWRHRVHEILTPVGTTAEALNWTRTDEIRVIHQNKGHDTAGSARRNITLLEIDLEENPEDKRAWFYLGNQYFALQQWGEAITCYERAEPANNPYQDWQTCIYLSMGYEKLGDIGAVRMAAYKALDHIPNHPEPYYRLAIAAMMAGDAGKCEFWTKLGDQMPEPPFFAFKNPLDRPYNARLTLATAYANAGMISRAREQLERAASVIPGQELLEGIARHRQQEEESQTADAFLRGYQQFPQMYDKEQIPPELWKFGRVRDAIVPDMAYWRKYDAQPRIIFFCGRSAEPWAPPSINTTGIGGSETAVIEIARRFAADNWQVDVYNDCDKFEGVHDGVGYWDVKRLQENEECDILVGWRNPQAHQLPIRRRVSVLWCHDLNQGAGQGDAYRQWDQVLGVSQWHAAYLSQLYDLSGVNHVPNGINLERFAEARKRVPFQVVYASSPDRGLERLLEMWPRIVEQEPAARLKVAYGWDTIDRYIQMGHQQLAVFKEHMQDLLARTPNVDWLGRLPQHELAYLYQESQILAYPSEFLEVSCIVVAEAMAAGCVPVTSGAGALPETIGEGGCVVKGNVYTRSWRDFYVHVLRGVMANPEVRGRYREAGRERAKQLTWEQSYQEFWKPLVERLLTSQKVEVLV